MTIFDLLRWTGTVGRRTYAVTGAVLLAVKYNLDRLISQVGFERPFSPLSYLDVTGVGRLTTLSSEDATYCAALVAVALPFIWAGTALTLRRLRDIGLPGSLVVLFFVPLLNLVFFTVLASMPGGSVAREEPEGGRVWLMRVVPESKLGSAAMSLLLTIPAALLGTYVAAVVLESYGWGLFVGVPFAVGMVAAMIYGTHTPRTLGESVGVSITAILLLAAGLAVLAVEGVICLAMAAPLGILVAAIGAAFGHALQRRPGAAQGAPPALYTVAIIVPLLIGVEDRVAVESPLWSVETSIEIDAGPEVVWENVVAFAELPPPEDWLFKTGIAYPTHATITGTGVGAVRRCEFTTGAFVEPITVWDAPHRLAFDVAVYPEPMVEWTPYRRVHPPHLDGYFVSERGQFLLTPLPGGRTRLDGTTWYRHGLWPGGYWRVWSDFILHRIHGRVLRHVQRLSEAP